MRELLKNLFDRVGEERILHILEKFYEIMAKDNLLLHFFIGKDLKHIAHQQFLFMKNAAGLTPFFQGRGPSTAHTHIPPIWQGHFDRRLVLLKDFLERENIDAPIASAWVQFEKNFEAIVVQDQK